MSSIFKALSDPTRRKVLELLRDGPLTAGELATHFDVSKPTLSAHFAVLKQAQLVRTERDGKQIRYHLNVSVLEDALVSLASVFGLSMDRPKGPAPLPTLQTNGE